MKTPTWCYTVQVLFLQGHSTCFGRKRPSSGVFKTSTAATGTCVIVVSQSSHLLIRTGRRCDDLPATITHVPAAAVLVLNTPDDGRLCPKHVEWLCRNETCTVLDQVGVSFDRIRYVNYFLLPRVCFTIQISPHPILRPTDEHSNIMVPMERRNLQSPFIHVTTDKSVWGQSSDT